MCADRRYSHGIPVSPKSRREAKLIAEYFKDILPIWLNGNCILLGEFGEMMTNVPCDEKHQFACQFKMRKYNLEKPNWKELVPGKEYALAYPRRVSETLYANYYEARYICNYAFNGAHLVEPTNQREDEAVVEKASSLFGSMWLGFNDFKQFNRWVRDSDGEDMTYANWFARKPWDTNRDNRHCALMTLVSYGVYSRQRLMGPHWASKSRLIICMY